MKDAETYLPTTWQSMYVGRLTWGAARAFHARTYMMRNDWGNMRTAAEDVINSKLYNLNTPYDKIFREDGENCSESVFELQCTSTESMPGSNTIGSQFASVQGVRGAGEWNLGWGQHTPTQELADAFEEGDPRKDETLLYFVRNGEDPDLIPANKPWGEKPVSNADVIAKYFNKKAYTDPSLRTKYTKGGYWVNIRLIRYADVVLMASEAACELNDLPAARNYLEMVRARARGNNADILPEVTTDDKMNFVMLFVMNVVWNWVWSLIVSMIWFVGVLQKKCCMQLARQVIRTDMLCCLYLRMKLINRMVYWFRIPIINLFNIKNV